MPLLNTRGGFVGNLLTKIAPGVSPLLINWCKILICPHPGSTWGRWSKTLIGAKCMFIFNNIHELFPVFLYTLALATCVMIIIIPSSNIRGYFEKDLSRRI